MLTLGQQLLAKKKKERERIAIPSGVPAVDTSYFVKLVSGDGHIFICHKDTAAVSKVLKPLIYPHLATPTDQAITEMILQSGDTGEVVVEGCATIHPPQIVYPVPKPPVSTADKTAKEVMALQKQMEEEAAKQPPPPPPGSAVLPNLLAAGNSDITPLQEFQQNSVANGYSISAGEQHQQQQNEMRTRRLQQQQKMQQEKGLIGNGDDEDDMDDDESAGGIIGATAIRFPYISGKLLEIVVQYFHHKQRYEHAADKRPPFPIDPAVALDLLKVSTKLQC